MSFLSHFWSLRGGQSSESGPREAAEDSGRGSSEQSGDASSVRSLELATTKDPTLNPGGLTFEEGMVTVFMCTVRLLKVS